MKFMKCRMTVDVNFPHASYISYSKTNSLKPLRNGLKMEI